MFKGLFPAYFFLAILLALSSESHSHSPLPRAAAATAENFNSRQGASLKQLKASLQAGCWTFHGFDVNQGGWNPGIEGDGAMVSAQGPAKFASSGIYTPLLQIEEAFRVSFRYALSAPLAASETRWIRICLTDGQNNIVKVLDNISLKETGVSAPRQYNASFGDLPRGSYRLALLYGGTGGSTRVAIDDMRISAALAFEGGCQPAPAAGRRELAGMPDRTAAGALLGQGNPEEGRQAFLIRGSEHGQVHLDREGNFVFIPHPGFQGRATSFTYKVCEIGGQALCSEDITAVVKFPEGTGLARLQSFGGWYRGDGEVELQWAALPGPAQVFTLERSFDGQSWIPAGEADSADGRNAFRLVDRLSRNKVLKRDIYYRVRQTDADGSESFSRLLILRVYATSTLTMIGVSPDPSRNDMAVQLQMPEPAYVSMRLLNGAGELVSLQTKSVPAGEQRLLMNGSSALRPGLYMLELIVNSKERMLVQLMKE